LRLYEVFDAIWCFVVRYQRFGGPYSLHLRGGCTQHGPSKGR